jgi:hypothetical protein
MTAPSPSTGPLAARVPGRVQAGEDLRGLDRAGLARVTAAVSCLGAGIVAVGVVGPFLRGESAPLAPLASAAVVALAVWQLGWALAALRALHLPCSRTATAISAAAALGWLATAPVLPSGAHTGHTSALLAALLAATSCGAGVLARLWEHSATRTPVPTAVQVAVLIVVAFGVAAVVTPALAAGPAGIGAMPMMDM